MLTQRLGSDTQKDPAFLDAFLQAVAAHPGCCDEVWLATDYGFPPLSTHRRSAELLAAAAKKLRKAGLRVSLQLSNSIGHGQYMQSRDCSGLVYEGSPVEHMVGHDGAVATYCFCWNGAHFRQYVLEELALYTDAIQPDTVWIDDDLRASNHAPVQYGCFCDGCMRRFNERWHTDFTRETLVEAISFGNSVWRERHIAFLRDGLADFTEAMGNVLHAHAPNCRMGLQYAAHGGYTGLGFSYILDAMERSTGKVPGTRPGGGVYTDHQPADFIAKGESIEYQNWMLPARIEERRPEIENLPDVVYGKSIGGTCLETTYYLAGGNTAMSYAMLMNDYEPMAWHEKMLAAFAAHRPYWERLAAVSKCTDAAGLVVALPRYGFRCACRQSMEYASESWGRALALRFDGIPVAMRQVCAPEDVFLLDARCAARMTDDEITTLLARQVITDGETIALLQQRGYALPICAERIDASRLSERFCEHPAQPFLAYRRWRGALEGAEAYALYGIEASEILSTYVEQASADTPPEQCVFTANAGVYRYRTTNRTASGCFHTPLGGHWAVFGMDLWSRVRSEEKRRQLLETAKYLSPDCLAADLLTPIQAILQPRVLRTAAEAGIAPTCSVSVTNATVAPSGPLTLRVRRPLGTQAVFMAQYRPAQLLPLDGCTDGTVEITLPDLSPWSVGTVFFADSAAL